MEIDAKGKMNIRLFMNKDYEEVCRWWHQHGEPVPPRSLISDYTYILENKDGTPWVCLSLIAFNTPHIAWSAGLVSNPDIPKEGRKAAVKMLWDHVAEQARKMGYNNLLCIAPNKALEKRYQELGFEVTKTNQTFLVKSLGG